MIRLKFTYRKTFEVPESFMGLDGKLLPGFRLEARDVEETIEFETREEADDYLEVAMARGCIGIELVPHR